MSVKKLFLILSVGLAVVVIMSLMACTAKPASTTSTTTTPGGGAVVNSDSIVTATIESIIKETTGYPWQLDVLIQSSSDVDSLPNPTKDSIGKTITVKTDQDMTFYKVGDVVTARVKYVGDVPKPGITLYMYSIAPAKSGY